MPIYTLNSCTIEVPKGGQSAKATRHVDKDGNPPEKPETAEFAVLGIDGAPTPEVQAQRWAMGLPAWEPPVIGPTEPVGQDTDGQFKPINELSYMPKVDEPTDLDEATDGQ